MSTGNSPFWSRIFVLGVGAWFSLSLGGWGEIQAPSATTSTQQTLASQVTKTSTDLMSHPGATAFPPDTNRTFSKDDQAFIEGFSTPKHINIPDETSPSITHIKPNEVFNERVIELTPRSSYVIHLPSNAAQVLLTDPKIADVHLAGPTKLYVYGRSPGRTEVIISTQDGQDTYRYPIFVKSDFEELRALIHRIAPNDRINVVSLPDGVLLEGTVGHAKMAEDLRALAQRFVGAQGNVVNQLTTKSANQVNLHVKVAEVQRTIMNQLGINWGTASQISHFRFGVLTGIAAPIDPTTVTATNPLGNFLRSSASPPTGNIGARFTDSRNDIATLLNVLAEEQLATILAEPNLITRSGEEASFLAGGEFPYPVAQGTGSSVTVSFQFKQYGISLSFLPVIMGDKISLRVRVEVSELDTSNSTKDQLGNTIPAILTRRAESTLEMENGQGMMMAGLLSDQASSSITDIPGLVDLPILGPLFRSNQFTSNKTELVMTVTPYIVQPVDQPQDIPLPTQEIKFATPLERAILGTIEQPSIGESSEPSPALVGEAGFYF